MASWQEGSGQPSAFSDLNSYSDVRHYHLYSSMALRVSIPSKPSMFICPDSIGICGSSPLCALCGSVVNLPFVRAQIEPRVVGKVQIKHN